MPIGLSPTPGLLQYMSNCKSALYKDHNNSLPLNKGQYFHTVVAPHDEYCPRVISRKYRGTPAKVNTMKYGIRKAPENEMS